MKIIPKAISIEWNKRLKPPNPMLGANKKHLKPHSTKQVPGEGRASKYQEGSERTKAGVEAEAFLGKR